MEKNSVYQKIDELVSELGTAANRREEMETEIDSLTAELAALDQMAEDATDREEYENIIAKHKEAELDLRFARNRQRLFDQTPRVPLEQIQDLLAQLGKEADAAAKTYRQKVEKPMAEIVKAGDEFDAAVNMVREAVRKLASVVGPVAERGDVGVMFRTFDESKLRSRAFCDGTIVYPGLRDALKLAASAKWESFDTH